MNTATLDRATLAATVDALAQVKAEISRLKTREDELKAALIESGESSIEGTAHRAALTYCPGREVIDWKTVAERAGASRQLITAHTTQGEAFYTVRVSARKA
jgi:hypothetical protein